MKAPLPLAVARGIALAVLALSPIAPSLSSQAEKAWIPRRADPYVYLHSDGWYYFCATAPEYDRIELRRARSLEALPEAPPLVVWRWRKRLFVEDRNFWAPELHFLDGKWFIYYAAGTSLAPYDVRIMVLENDGPDPLAGKWLDRGRVDTGRNSLCLDATVFEHRGQRYLVWAQRWEGRDGTPMDLYLAPMRSPTALAAKAAMICRASRPWEMRDPANLKAQGPAVLARNGRVFIAYSCNATDERYCVGLVEASEDADLLDPGSWRKLPGPALESEPEAGIFGPGHNSFTTSPDGSVDYIVFHARDYEKVEGAPILDANRGAYIRKIRWDDFGRPAFR